MHSWQPSPNAPPRSILYHPFNARCFCAWPWHACSHLRTLCGRPLVVSALSLADFAMARVSCRCGLREFGYGSRTALAVSIWRGWCLLFDSLPSHAHPRMPCIICLPKAWGGGGLGARALERTEHVKRTPGPSPLCLQMIPAEFHSWRIWARCPNAASLQPNHSNHSGITQI